MVLLTTFCSFCGISLDSDQARCNHADSRYHEQKVREFFEDREQADMVIRSTRPTEHERAQIQECIKTIQVGARPAEIHPTGSVGKETALRNCHDLDIAAVVDTFDPSNPRGTVELLANRLRQKGVRVLRAERHLVKVQHAQLSVDVVQAELTWLT